MAATTILERRCPLCGISHKMEFDSALLNEGMEKCRNGLLVQHAFPNFTPSQREFLMTGICDPCFNSICDD